RSDHSGSAQCGRIRGQFGASALSYSVGAVGGFAGSRAAPPKRADTDLILGVPMRLNGATIPDAIVRRVIQRRGVEHSFADLDPARSALVVIDLQHAFMNEEVGFAPVPAAREIVPAVNRLAAAVRETGGGVFWIKMTHDERCFAEWSVAYELP